jgi:hypothetical protein
VEYLQGISYESKRLVTSNPHARTMIFVFLPITLPFGLCHFYVSFRFHLEHTPTCLGQSASIGVNALAYRLFKSVVAQQTKKKAMLLLLDPLPNPLMSIKNSKSPPSPHAPVLSSQSTFRYLAPHAPVLQKGQGVALHFPINKTCCTSQ